MTDRDPLTERTEGDLLVRLRYHSATLDRALMTEAADRIEQLERELAEANELHVMQLAAIMTASMQNTRASIAQRIDWSSPYCTQAYMDVCAAVNREICARERAEALSDRPEGERKP